MAFGEISPAKKAVAITPGDSSTHNHKALWVGVSGDVTVDVKDSGTNITFKNVQGVLDVQVTRVYSTGTTATDIVGLD